MSENREVLEVDILFVGAGAASLSGALRLHQLIEAHNARVAQTGQGSALSPMIAVVEKGSEVGAHSLSGAVLDPIALRELIPDYESKGCPIEKKVEAEDVYYLTPKRALRFPVTPPPLRNHGLPIVSLARFNRWLGGLVEGAGVNVFAGFAGVEILEENGAVVGIRTGDKGIDRHGQRKPNFEPGIDLRAKLTIFGDGPRGYLSKQLIARHGLLEGKSIQTFETGVKEVFELPPGRTDVGRVIHTMGHPFRADSVGGTFIYTMADNLVAVGLVTPLDYSDPFINPHEQLQQFKEHPTIRKLLAGGKSAYYGAKVISAAGYHSIPKLYTNGALLIGEAASLVDMARLKGIHLAMKSGMLAAETAFHALIADDFSSKALAPYEHAIYDSYVGKQLYKVRNFHRAMSLGLPRALMHVGLQQMTGGADILGKGHGKEDRYTFKSVAEYYGVDIDLPPPRKYDGREFLDKLQDVYLSGTMHGEDQPSHLLVLDTKKCYDTCVATYRYPCNRFCPANVYEMVASDGGALRLQVNFANCVHCQTCDIKCPLDNIRWTPPEGGQGPNYTVL
ncbi:MAG TPA: electron transfer flavoprotein-ubiquinone oxidoreductase [Candidatus Krumholzibacteria bacterium]|nr:electron transfer flavoprotein-ubiquinone oxidoreductase [Candidatus Krumholzibacteria bacterium]